MSTKSSVLTVVNAGGHLTQAMCMMKTINEFHLVTSVNVGETFGARSVTIIESTQFNAFKHFKNVFVALSIIRRIKPKAVFSTGGPICIPFAIAAKVLGIKFVYLDTLSRVVEPSNTARFLYKYRLATEMFCQWETVSKQYPRMKYYGKTFNICNHRD